MVIHSFVLTLFAEPHTMIRTLIERTARPHVSYSIPDYSSIKVSCTLPKSGYFHCCSWSNMPASLPFNTACLFHHFNWEFDSICQPVSERILLLRMHLTSTWNSQTDDLAISSPISCDEVYLLHIALSFSSTCSFTTVIYTRCKNSSNTWISLLLINGICSSWSV